jgi:hypothetical protein
MLGHGKSPNRQGKNSADRQSTGHAKIWFGEVRPWFCWIFSVLWPEISDCVVHPDSASLKRQFPPWLELSYTQTHAAP